MESSLSPWKVAGGRLRSSPPHLVMKSIPPVLVCVLGAFRVLKMGRPITIHSGGKIELFLRLIAVRSNQSIPREQLLQSLWPQSTFIMAGQSLNSLVHELHRMLRDVLGGAAPVVHAGGLYRLHMEAGIGIDVNLFDTLATAGDRCARECNYARAVRHYRDAIALYRGDLDGALDVESVVERERLRVRCLSLLAFLADYYYKQGVYTAALNQALLLLGRDPCREDAHRIAMRCHVKLGDRAQALRQYRLCEQILRAEFDAVPEPNTTGLFDKIRLHPGKI